MDIELRELKYFVAVAKMETLTRAADSLFVSQPTLTKAIQKLEATIGAPLFDREKNQLRITDVGQELLEKSQQLLSNYEDVWRGINDVRNIQIGYISIGLPPCTIPLLFHNTFLQYKSVHPNICLNFSDNGRDEVVKGLLSGELDLGFMVQDFPDEGIEEVLLYSSDMVAVMRQTHPLSDLTALEIKQLKNEPLCILQENYLMAKQTFSKCRQEGFQPIISCSNSNCDFLIKLAQAEDQIAVVPRPIFLEGSYKGMIAVPFAEPWPWLLCMGWRKDTYISYATRELRSLILSQFQQTENAGQSLT